MKYCGLPLGMWMLYVGSFRKQLTIVLGQDPKEAKRITAEAKQTYKEIIARLPAFEKEDEFETNIVSCAMFSAFLLPMRDRPPVQAAADYYSAAMMTAAARRFFRLKGKQKFTAKDIRQMRRTAALKAADRNPYSWNMQYLPYSDGSGYECRFDRCGICTLMKELGLYSYTPAMCHLDYDMNDAGGACCFVRQYTLASGGPYCDCGYKKK